MKTKFLLTVEHESPLEDMKYLAILTEERINSWLSRHKQDGHATAFKDFKVEELPGTTN